MKDEQRPDNKKKKKKDHEKIHKLKTLHRKLRNTEPTRIKLSQVLQEGGLILLYYRGIRFVDNDKLKYKSYSQYIPPKRCLFR